MTSPIKISFCTTCKGRLHHLKKTLPKNLRDNRNFRGVEFLLLNYSSRDGLDRWVKTAMARHLKSGRLVYYKFSGRKYFQHAHAKNVIHRVARGDIVCNLDADNFTGPDFARFLHDLFRKRRRIIVRARNVHSAGGRIALRKRDFVALGGYNEAMHWGWGFEDNDLEWRAKAYGLRSIILLRKSGFLNVIKHGDGERTRFTVYKNKRSSSRRHERISRKNYDRASYTANSGREWGEAELKRMFAAERD